MKSITLFLILSSLVAIPLLIRKSHQRIPLLTDENRRYDIEDFITEETL